MKNSLRLVSAASVHGLLLLATVSFAHATVFTPEPADYAIGFGAVALGFVIWRNSRKARKSTGGPR